MKKTLIAIAALAATSAFAQSSVTLYGVVDAGINQVKTTNVAGDTESTTKTGGNAAGAWASNRLGFKGTEDIGNGTKADFVYEMALAAGTTGDLTATNVRQSWAGLSDVKLGQVQIGRQYNPAFLVNLAHDAGAGNNLSFGRTVYGNGPVTNARTSGAVTYTTPAIASLPGLTAKLSHGTDEVNLSTAASTTGTKNTGGSIVYANGPLSVSYGFNKINALNAAGDKNEKIVGATYVVGKAKLLAVYGSSKTTDALGDQSAKRNGYQLGLQYPITATVDSFLTYGRATVQAASTAAEGTAKGTQAGAIYNLSKRTGIYAAYGKTTGDTSATATAPATIAATSKGTELAIGVRHSF